METYDPSFAAGIFALLGVIFIPLMAIGIFTIVCQWMVFEKAGQPGWACIVPIYNLLVYFKIIGKPWTWILLLIPPISIVGGFIVWISGSIALARSFGKDTGFAVGLMFLGPIFYAILAFDKSIQYVGPNGEGVQSLDSQIDSIGKPAL